MSDSIVSAPTYSAQTKRRVKRGLVASTLAVILVMSFLLTRPPLVDTVPGKISVEMTAQVYRDGVLVGERVKDDDLLVWNFLNLTQALFYWPNDATYDAGFWPSGEAEEVPFKVWNETAGGTIWDTSEQYLEGRAMCDYGEGTTAPTRDDYHMEDPFAVEDLYEVYELGTDSITLTFIYTSDGSYDWSEVGLNKRTYSYDWDDCLRVFYCRDTFTPIAVVASDSLVVNYRFTFATGYTSNVLKLLLYFFIGGATDTDTTMSLTDSSGTARTVRLYTDDPDDEAFAYHVEDTFNGGWITIADSTSGIPSRSAYHLSGSTVTTQSTSYVDGDPNYDVTVFSTIVPSSALTVRAAGSFMYYAYVGGNAYFLMWALTHTAVYVAANTPVQATFTLEL
jgi:hypothetical protein